MLKYGVNVERELLEVRESLLDNYQRLQLSVEKVVDKISIYSHKEESLKERVDAMQAEYDTLEKKYTTATGSDQAQLGKEMTALERDLVNLKNQYDEAFTVYSQAQQSLAANQESARNFNQMTRDIGRQALIVREKMDNIAEIYRSAPEATKAMLMTAGMEAFDKTTNAATDAAVRMIKSAREGIQDTTLSREETMLISEKKMAEYISQRTALDMDFNARFGQVQERAHRSQAERYSGE